MPSSNSLSFFATGPTCKRFFFSEGLRRKSTAAGEETEQPIIIREKYWKDPSKGGLVIVTFFTLLAVSGAIYYCTDITKQVYFKDFDFPAFRKKSPVEEEKEEKGVGETDKE